MKIITLTTDFGTTDWFVGTLKGVILRLCPTATLVDLTHAIPPGDIRAAAFALLQAYDYFPTGTIHLAVVDPGVGSQRPAIALRTRRFTFLGPDNGVLSLAAASETVRSVRRLANPKLLLPRVSQTFHGRDIFAPMAAHLCRGARWSDLGPRVTNWQRLAWPVPVRAAGKLRGEVVWVDRFGNGITNLPATEAPQMIEVRVNRHRLGTPVTHYQAVPPRQPLALVGSCGLLEIAVNGDSAERKLGLRIGTPVTAMLRSCPNPKAHPAA
jgi:S-adenosylmethionine hydrolase